MNDLDDDLRAAGASWRIGLPPPREPDWDTIMARRSIGLVDPLKSIGVVAAVLIVTLGGLNLLTRTTSRGSANRPIDPGDSVIGGGTVLVRPDSTLLCLAGIQTSQMDPQAPTCTPIKVSLGVIDPTSLRDATTIGEVTFIEVATVTGTWNGVEIARPAVTPVEFEPDRPPVLGCTPRPAATSNASLSPLEIERRVGILSDEVASHPSLYGGYWNVDDPVLGEYEVVALTADVEAASVRLESLIGLPLCTVSASYSLDQMAQTVTSLAASDGSRVARIDVRRNAVEVLVATPTQSVVSMVAAYPSAYLNPLVVVARN